MQLNPEQATSEFLSPAQIDAAVIQYLQTRSAMYGHDQFKVLDDRVVGTYAIGQQPRDMDYLMLVTDINAAFKWLTESDTYASCSNGYGDIDRDGWTAVRKGDVNIVLCFDKGFFERWVAAVKVCAWMVSEQKIDLTKLDRKHVHNIIRDLT